MEDSLFRNLQNNPNQQSIPLQQVSTPIQPMQPSQPQQSPLEQLKQEVYFLKLKMSVFPTVTQKIKSMEETFQSEINNLKKNQNDIIQEVFRLKKMLETVRGEREQFFKQTQQQAELITLMTKRIEELNNLQKQAMGSRGKQVNVPSQIPRESLVTPVNPMDHGLMRSIFDSSQTTQKVATENMFDQFGSQSSNQGLTQSTTQMQPNSQVNVTQGGLGNIQQLPKTGGQQNTNVNQQGNLLMSQYGQQK